MERARQTNRTETNVCAPRWKHLEMHFWDVGASCVCFQFFVFFFSNFTLMCFIFSALGSVSPSSLLFGLSYSSPVCPVSCYVPGQYRHIDVHHFRCICTDLLSCSAQDHTRLNSEYFFLFPSISSVEKHMRVCTKFHKQKKKIQKSHQQILAADATCWECSMAPVRSRALADTLHIWVWYDRMWWC